MWQAYNGLGLLGYVHDTVNAWNAGANDTILLGGIYVARPERYCTNCEQALNNLMLHISEKHRTQ